MNPASSSNLHQNLMITRQLLFLKIHRSMSMLRGVHVNSCKIIDKWFNGTREGFGRRDCATRDYYEISIERAWMYRVASLQEVSSAALTTCSDCSSSAAANCFSYEKHAAELSANLISRNWITTRKSIREAEIEIECNVETTVVELIPHSLY